MATTATLAEQSVLAGRARKLLEPLDQWECQCHAASTALVRSGEFAPARVARGGCAGVASQHSWLVLGMDCYDVGATIIDPTLWSYVPEVEGVWVGTYGDGLHTPHGKGSIWEWGRPDDPVEEPIVLTPRDPLSAAATAFIDMIGPLDRAGWAVLAHAPVEEWPAGEIIAAISDTEPLKALVPIDRLGMLTDRNPGGLYLKEE